MDMFIDENSICVKQKAYSREDAIRITAQPLVNQGKITSQYVQSMIDVLKTMGTYMVISPGIAIAHARPSSDVIEDCASLATFDPPVNFGHSDNDPVELVFVIAAKESKRHLNSMRSIASVMCRKDFMERMRGAFTVTEVINYFKEI